MIKSQLNLFRQKNASLALLVLFAFLAIFLHSELGLRLKAETNHSQHSYQSLISNSMKADLRKIYEKEIEDADASSQYQINLQNTKKGCTNFLYSLQIFFPSSKRLLALNQVYII